MVLLRTYAHFVAALAISIQSFRVHVGSRRAKADGVHRGLGLPEAFGTCGPGVHLCRLSRQCHAKEWKDQSEGEERSHIENICLPEDHCSSEAGRAVSVSRTIIGPAETTISGGIGCHYAKAAGVKIYCRAEWPTKNSSSIELD
jgi:hypothetical protein